MAKREPGRFVAYLRVSTDSQGRSGLGLEAQRQSVAAHVAQAGGEVVAEFREVESGKRADRPQRAAALASCRTRRAVLVIAKLDRLARNARFPPVRGGRAAAGPVGKFLVTQMAAVAELEAGLTSQRTRAALAVAKARGVQLGNPPLSRQRPPWRQRRERPAAAKWQIERLTCWPSCAKSKRREQNVGGHRTWRLRPGCGRSRPVQVGHPDPNPRATVPERPPCFTP